MANTAWQSSRALFHCFNFKSTHVSVMKTQILKQISNTTAAAWLGEMCAYDIKWQSKGHRSAPQPHMQWIIGFHTFAYYLEVQITKWCRMASRFISRHAMHVCMHAQMDKKPENNTLVASSIGWEDAQKQLSKLQNFFKTTAQTSPIWYFQHRAWHVHVWARLLWAATVLSSDKLRL